MTDLAANRALARKQLVLIDEAWALMEFLSKNARIDIDGGTFGPWGRRRLEALRRAGAGKAEIVAALEKYIKDLERMQAIVEARKIGRPLGSNHPAIMKSDSCAWRPRSG